MSSWLLQVQLALNGSWDPAECSKGSGSGNAQAQACLGWPCTDPARAGAFTPEAAPAAVPSCQPVTQTTQSLRQQLPCDPLMLPLTQLTLPGLLLSISVKHFLKGQAKETTGVTLSPWNTEFIHFYQHWMSPQITMAFGLPASPPECKRLSSISSYTKLYPIWLKAN